MLHHLKYYLYHENLSFFLKVLRTCINNNPTMNAVPWQYPTSRSWMEYAFITLNRASCPIPSFFLKKSCSGYVLAISRLITFSHADWDFMYSEYFSLSSESCAPHKSCHAIPRKWCGIPLRTKSCFIREPKGKMCNCNISDRLYVCTYVSCEGGKQKTYLYHQIRKCALSTYIQVS